MRYSTISAVSLSCILLAACDKDPSVMSTGPDVRYAQSSSTPCSSSLARDISQLQNTLFSHAYLTAVRDAFALVVNDCVSNPPQAKEEMLSYVQLTIDFYRAGNVDQPRQGTKEGALVALWDLAFTYVDYPAPGLPASVLLAEGAVGVMPENATVDFELKAKHAAIYVQAQNTTTGDPRGHLFSIYPLTTGCLTGTNLQQSGPCFDFAANPVADPKFDPKVKVGICQPVAATYVIPANAALGHLQDAGNTTVTGPAGIYPDYCDHDFYTGSWTGGFSDIATRLAWLAGRALGVQTAYAVNGGLGGLDDDLSSEFGAVDLLVFKATFTANTPGSPIVDGDTADVGTWTVDVTPPGSITVQSSLGDLDTKPVVLSQGGGNCLNCGGLLLQGNLHSEGPPATTGKYRVEWYSVQSAPSVKEAPFVLRSSSGQEIARVTYSTVSNANVLSYNGPQFGTWTRNVTQRFEIIVDLDTKKTSLSVPGFPSISNQDFVCLTAQPPEVPCTAATVVDFATIAAEFSGIDSGVMGWDNIKVTRLSDQ
jgi:hypothetical protein